MFNILVKLFGKSKKSILAKDVELGQSFKFVDGHSKDIPYIYRIVEKSETETKHIIVRLLNVNTGDEFDTFLCADDKAILVN